MTKTKYCLKVFLLLCLSLLSFHLYISFWMTDICRWNEGVALGLLPFFPSEYLALATLMLLFVTVFLLWRVFAIFKKYWMVLAVLFLAGLANVVDRFAHGAVCDYIAILNFPVMNINDILISVSLIAILAMIFYEEVYCKKRG
jgi:signal peptidase II